jgi:hypothetical protein
MRQQCPSRLGGDHALPSTGQQWRAKRLLHIAYSGRSGSQREMGALGAVGDAAASAT